MHPSHAYVVRLGIKVIEFTFGNKVIEFTLDAYQNDYYYFYQSGGVHISRVNAICTHVMSISLVITINNITNYECCNIYIYIYILLIRVVLKYISAPPSLSYH